MKYFYCFLRLFYLLILFLSFSVNFLFSQTKDTILWQKENVTHEKAIQFSSIVEAGWLPHLSVSFGMLVHKRHTISVGLFLPNQLSEENRSSILVNYRIIFLKRYGTNPFINLSPLITGSGIGLESGLGVQFPVSDPFILCFGFGLHNNNFISKLTDSNGWASNQIESSPYLRIGFQFRK